MTRKRSELESRFIAEIETHIARAISGSEPEEALSLLDYFCKVVARGDQPPEPVIRYLADSFRSAIGLSEGRPDKVDCRKPLGLIRARRGNPHRKRLLTSDQMVELLNNDVDADNVSFEHAEKLKKDVRRDQKIQIGVEFHNQFLCELERLAMDVPDLVSRAEVTAAAEIKQRYADAGVKLGDSDITRARRQLAKTLLGISGN
ncbi:MAG: hypothetical protein MUF80_10325 [Burkholderiales bacterium]|jgi:hypothetical protein|nr:hypothetical protein [Burkholderiales bacterium]